MRRVAESGVVAGVIKNDLGWVLIPSVHVPALIAATPRPNGMGGQSPKRVAPDTSAMEWMDFADCRTTDPALFHGPDGEHGRDRRIRETAAKAICAGCPVLTDCRTWITIHPEEWGVWAGLSEKDRSKSTAGTDRPTTNTKAA
jgi:WhiB family redox-sensing transcriptional regulator